METKELNQILEIASLFEVNKILWMIISFIVLFFAVKKLNQWSSNLKEKFPSKRLFILQSSTIISFVLSIVGTFAIIYGVLKPSKEILLALTGSAAVAIGFSLKDLVSSLIAGIVLLFDRPFQVGDRVTFKNIYGEIVKIGLRAVRLNTLDDNLVTIPNSEFINNAVASGNAGALDMMVVMNIHLALDENIPKVQELLYEVLITSRYVYLAKPVVVLVSEAEVAHRLVLKFTMKAYVLDVKYEKAFESDVYTRAIKELNKLEVRRPIL